MGRQGRLSRHKVSVGEPADGSPPIIIQSTTCSFTYTSFSERIKKKNKLECQWAHSPMVEYFVCNEETRVRFTMGPFK